MSLPQPEQDLTRHIEVLDRTLPQVPPHPSHEQQARLVEALRLQQAITEPTATKRKRDPRPKLDNAKCARCRKDKVKCGPQPRVWPDKCERCSSKGFECSPAEVKRRARKKVSPTSIISSRSEPTHQDHQVSERPGLEFQLVQESAEPQVDDVQESWNFADVTNLITFVQLLNHERSLVAEANSYLEKLNLAFSDEDLDKIYSVDVCMLKVLEGHTLQLIADVQRFLRDRRHSASLTMADQILYEHAHEAIGEDFAVPRHDPISEGSLAELPIGVQIRHLIRKLRLDIRRCGSCDFKPLYRLLSQLGHEHRGWAARFSFFHYPEWLFDGSHLGPAYSLVISQELLTEPLIRIWVRGYILHAGNENFPFPITRFAELWNADSNSVNLLTLAGGDAEDFQHLPLLHVAVLCNKPRIVRALVKDNPNTKCLLTLDNFSAFHSAASIGSIDCYRELLKCEMAELVIREWYDCLPLHSAARNGHKHMVDYILSIHSDDQDYVNKTDASGVTPLMQAAKHGKYDVVQFLLDYPGVDLTASDEHWRTALTHANENENILRLILSRLPDQYFNTPGEEDQIPLHWLVTHAGPKALRLVLGLPSILPDQEDESVDTPLCHAVRAGNLEAVKALGIRRDVDATKLSTCKLWDKTNYIDDAKRRASKNNNYSQILDWLKIHCKELEADLADWVITTEDAAQGTRNSERKTQEE